MLLARKLQKLGINRLRNEGQIDGCGGDHVDDGSSWVERSRRRLWRRREVDDGNGGGEKPTTQAMAVTVDGCGGFGREYRLWQRRRILALARNTFCLNSL
nr:hypothetical protein Iba_chr14bCG0870 [Ipomoea batatas]